MPCWDLQDSALRLKRSIISSRQALQQVCRASTRVAWAKDDAGLPGLGNGRRDGPASPSPACHGHSQARPCILGTQLQVVSWMECDRVAIPACRQVEKWVYHPAFDAWTVRWEAPQPKGFWLILPFQRVCQGGPVCEVRRWEVSPQNSESPCEQFRRSAPVGQGVGNWVLGTDHMTYGNSCQC